MDILVSAGFFLLGFYLGKTKTAKKDTIYLREYGIINGLMAPKSRK